MGLTKQYLRYVPSGKFNIIASAGCNVVFVTLEGQEGRYLAVGASEDIVIWDMRLGEKAQVIPGGKYEVTQLAASPDKASIVAGHSDGTVKVYDLVSGENKSIFSGHRTAVISLAFDSQGHRLASGGKDTEIVIWDTVAEAGLIRLSGHKGPVTQVQFMTTRNIVVSSSKDTFIKLWDLETGHCFKTIAGHLTEVWGLCIAYEDSYIVAGSSDSELRVWSVTDSKEGDAENKENNILIGEDDAVDISPVSCIKAGSLLRNGHGRVVSMSMDASGHILAVHGNDNNVELFHFLPDSAAKLKLKKRLRKEKKCGIDHKESEEATVTLKDLVRRLPSITKTEGKVKAVHLVLGRGAELRVGVTTNSNAVDLYSLNVDNYTGLVTNLRSIRSHGHHSEVRCVAFSSDNLAVVSGSAVKIKMWNRPSLACLRTVKTGYALSITFIPGDRHVLVGCKDGHLLIIDISVGDILEKIPAHTSELWSICPLPDQTGVMTGGSDCTVKFWELELIPDTKSGGKAKVLSLLHTRTLKLDEGVLCVSVSANSKFIAVALLDCTVKVFFLDTFKFYLSLYGHKLPVLCMDISSDSAKIATGSADRNVKIWGLDFGDCQKSLFAHDDSVTALRFIHNTHYFFTAGKDGKIKEWDADNFEKIVTLEGHHGEAWGLAVSPSGQFVVSCGQDRVIRLYERTDEPLVLEDEREMEREREEEETLATGPDTVAPGHGDMNLASKKTVDAEKAAELLLECLKVCTEYRAELEECQAAGRKPPQIPLLMTAYNCSNPDDYLLEMLKRIRASELEEALLLLPYTSVCELLPQFVPLLGRKLHSDVVCRALVFLIRVHHRPLVTNPSLLPLIQKLNSLAMQRITDFRDLIGENVYGLMFQHREMEAKEGVKLFWDATKARKEREKKKRKREKAIQRALLKL